MTSAMQSVRLVEMVITFGGLYHPTPPKKKIDSQGTKLEKPAETLPSQCSSAMITSVGTALRSYASLLCFCLN